MTTSEDAELAAKPALTRLPDRALNAEAAPHLLDDPETPVARFFVRNNGLTPERVDRASWRLAVDGEVERPLSLTLAELAARFPVVEAPAVLECAGNGRALYAPPAEGLPWGLGAVGCARWTGVRMADVLAAAGVRASAVYVAHLSPDVMVDGSGRPALSRGLPLWKALRPETLLCFAMNGEPLPVLHGGPLRVVAPGFPGSAWQKWLDRLWVRDREHDGEKMTGLNYRLPRRPLRPGEEVADTPFDVIEDMPPRAMITWPGPDFRLAAAAPFEARGFAWSGHVPVARVAVSADGGDTWREARLEEAAAPFAWRRFRVEVAAPAGPLTLIARATDIAGRTQPLDQAPWNPRGYCNNVAQRTSGSLR